MDFTNNPGPQRVTLNTGTNDIIGTIGTIAAAGKSNKVICAVKCISGAVTGFTAQVSKSTQFGFTDFLTGVDWISDSNGAQRSWTSTNPPNALTAGQISYFDVIPDQLSYLQFLASGTPGTVLLVDFTSIFNTTEKV